MAERLEDASVGSLVYVDARGQVRSPSRYRRLTALYLLGLGGTLCAVNWLYWAIGGPIGLAVGGAMTVLLARHLPAWSRVRRAVTLIVAERLDEAERLLARVDRGRGLPASMKAGARRNLARIAALRGRHGDALAFSESALALLGRRSSQSERRMLTYACVVTLVNLDRVAEARVRFDTLPRALEGDYLRAQRAAAELYLAFAEGEHRFDPAFLREQADIAIALPSARVLLGLLAWAQGRAGHPRLAADLLAQARERPGESHVHRLYPRLAVWMDGGT
jgi:hypothetical protein